MKILKYFLLALGALSLIVFAFSHYHSVMANEQDNEGENGNHLSGPFNAPGFGMAPGLNRHNNNEEVNGENRDFQGAPLLSLQPNNKAIIHGASLVSQNGQSLTVKIFGLSLNINLASSTTIIAGPPINASSSTAMQINDTLDIRGTIDSNSGIITADWIRDESQQQLNIQNIRQQIEALFEQLRKLQEQIRIQGGQ